MDRSGVHIAVVMPRGGRMDGRHLNSMETVALTLHRFSAYRASTTFICEDGAETPGGPETTVRLPAGLSRRAHAAAVLKALQALRPDVVEFHQQLGTSADLSRRLPGVRCLLFRHTRVDRPRNPIQRLRYRSRLRAFDRIILVSRAARAEFLSDFPGFEDRAAVISNPIDLDSWRGDVERKEQLILFSGRAVPEKGLDVFCQALTMVLDQAPDWRGALMLGEWDRSRDWAEPFVRLLDRFGDRVEIHRSASVAAVQDMNRRAAIAVTPSRVREAMGLTAMEALAGGAALVSSGRGGLREASGCCAVYVDPPEAHSLADAMLKLADAPERRLALGRQGQAYVSEMHDPARRAKELDDLRAALIDSAAVHDIGDACMTANSRGR